MGMFLNLAQRLRFALEEAERETEDVLDEWAEAAAYHKLRDSVEKIAQDVERIAEENG